MKMKILPFSLKFLDKGGDQLVWGGSKNWGRWSYIKLLSLSSTKIFSTKSFPKSFQKVNRYSQLGNTNDFSIGHFLYIHFFQHFFTQTFLSFKEKPKPKTLPYFCFSFLSLFIFFSCGKKGRNEKKRETRWLTFD